MAEAKIAFRNITCVWRVHKQNAHSETWTKNTLVVVFFVVQSLSLSALVYLSSKLYAFCEGASGLHVQCMLHVARFNYASRPVFCTNVQQQQEHQQHQQAVTPTIAARVHNVDVADWRKFIYNKLYISCNYAWCMCTAFRAWVGVFVLITQTFKTRCRTALLSVSLKGCTRGFMSPASDVLAHLTHATMPP